MSDCNSPVQIEPSLNHHHPIKPGSSWAIDLWVYPTKPSKRGGAKIFPPFFGTGGVVWLILRTPRSGQTSKVPIESRLPTGMSMCVCLFVCQFNQSKNPKAPPQQALLTSYSVALVETRGTRERPGQSLGDCWNGLGLGTGLERTMNAKRCKFLSASMPALMAHSEGFFSRRFWGL